MTAVLISPFVHDNLDVAYAAYCAAPHAQRAGFKKPTKAQFKKLYAEKHEAKKAEYLTKINGGTPAAAEADPFAHIDPQVLEVLRTLGIAVPAPEEDEEEPVDPQVQALIDAGVDPVIAEKLSGMLGTGTATAAPATRKKQYRARTASSEVPANAARNQLLWALNTEGLLREALDKCEEQGLDYITRDVGTELMTREFGPMPARATTT